MLWKLRSSLTDNYAIVVSPDQASDEIYLERFGLPAGRLVRSGLPRWDALVATPVQQESIRRSLATGERALWFYLPTHRDRGRVSPSPNVDVARRLIAASEDIGRMGIHLVIKPHFYERDHFAGLRDTREVSLRLDLPDDINRCLAAAQGIITDYSSVAFDSYKLGIPVVLFPYDYDEYVSRGAGIDPGYFSSAPSARTVEDLLPLLSSAGLRREPGPQRDGGHAAGESHCEVVVRAIMARLPDQSLDSRD
jgi:CDP-glycerol glycerophosphotransferase (TagB/SpsB family)